MSIEARNVTKRFGDFVALNDVTLRVPAGELVALLGPSGSGKTTLLRIIAGLESPDNGTVLFDGEETTHRSVQDRAVGFVFQHYALFRHMTVFDNVAFGLTVKPRSQRPSAEQIRARVTGLLKLVQLDWLANRFPSQLSGGQRQRVALARALAVEPKVLLLDEPFGSLDAKVRQELRRWLRRLHDEIHVTSIFVTHDQEEALSISDRLAIMDAGRIRQVGTPVEVYTRPSDRFVADFVGIANFLAGTVRTITPEGLVIDSPLGSLTIPAHREYPEGWRVTILVRPEALRLSSDPGPGKLPARIRSTSFLGGMRRHHVQVGDLSLIADEAFPGTKEGGGQELWLTVDAANLQVVASEPA